MKITTLKTALEHYLLSADCSEVERKDVLSALTSCTQAAERYDNKDIWHDECYIITPDTLSNLLNTTTYDSYGRLCKVHGDGMKFFYYAQHVRHKLGYNELTDEQLAFAYEIISDLWDDNESNGYHNNDGTFRK